MATEKWIAGSLVGLTWANAFTASTLNTLANGNAIASDLVLNNATALDMYADFSIAFGSITWAAPNFLGVYLYPLNQDGTTYGDDRFATAVAGPPGANYWVGNISCAVGAAANEGMISRIVLPPGSFKFVIWNQAGNTLAGSGANVAKYRTYNRQVV